MKILITGATGFVGTTLIPYLLNHEVDDLCLLVRNYNKSKGLFGNLNINTISTESENWRNEIQNFNPEIVLHLAAYYTGSHDEENIYKIINANVIFTALLLETISRTECKYFVNIGTFSEFKYGEGEYNPNNLYSASKTSERSIIQYYQSISKWKWINVIIYSPYGRRNNYKKVIDYMIDSFESENLIDFTKGEQVLDFIHIDDIANFFYTLFLKIYRLNDNYYQFHLGTGVGHSVREVGNIMEAVWGKKMNANFGGRNYSEQDIMYAIAPIGKNLELLNWKPNIGIKEGIQILYKDLYDG